jgi:hypothetical protein
MSYWAQEVQPLFDFCFQQMDSDVTGVFAWYLQSARLSYYSHFEVAARGDLKALKQGDGQDESRRH